MMNAEECRARVRHASECAARSPAPGDRIAWQVMAREWESLGTMIGCQEAMESRLTTRPASSLY
jgi:hypothetical protein